MAAQVLGQNEGPNGKSAQIQRPARALVGWMTHEQALQIQSGLRGDGATPDCERRAEVAREAVRARPIAIDQSDLISDAPAELDGHISALTKCAAGAAFFKEGWKVSVVDLRKVCALQPIVFTDRTEQRTAGAPATDLPSLAAITLPLPSNTELPAQFDQARQTWILNSPNPNLRIVGNYAGEVQPGVIGLGLTVTVMPSFLQVVCFQDRFLLRDGYHRAYGLLCRGISTVPALVRDFGRFGELGLPPGMFSQSVYLGDRPPTLPDYMDDAVSIDVMVPATQKMIIVQGMELTPVI